MVGRAGLEPASPVRETELQSATLPITCYLPIWCCERDLNSQNCVSETQMYAVPSPQHIRQPLRASAGSEAFCLACCHSVCLSASSSLSLTTLPRRVVDCNVCTAYGLTHLPSSPARSALVRFFDLCGGSDGGDSVGCLWPRLRSDTFRHTLYRRSP